MLSDLVTTRYSEIDAAFADESGDVSGGEEDEGYRVVLDEGNVEAGFTAELNVGAGEEVEGRLLEAALWMKVVSGCGEG